MGRQKGNTDGQTRWRLSGKQRTSDSERATASERAGRPIPCPQPQTDSQPTPPTPGGGGTYQASKSTRAGERGQGEKEKERKQASSDSSSHPASYPAAHDIEHARYTVPEKDDERQGKQATNRSPPIDTNGRGEGRDGGEADSGTRRDDGR